MKLIFKLFRVLVAIAILIPCISMAANYAETGNWLWSTTVKQCQARGIAYYKEMDITPTLSDGTPIELAAYRKCRRSHHAF